MTGRRARLRRTGSCVAGRRRRRSLSARGRRSLRLEGGRAGHRTHCRRGRDTLRCRRLRRRCGSRGTDCGGSPDTDAGGTCRGPRCASCSTTAESTSSDTRLHGKHNRNGTARHRGTTPSGPDAPPVAPAPAAAPPPRVADSSLTVRSLRMPAMERSPNSLSGSTTRQSHRRDEHVDKQQLQQQQQLQ